MTNFSGNGWSSNSHDDFSASPQTRSDYEFQQQNKPGKALVGIAILVALTIALAFMHPASHDTASTPSIVRDSGSAVSQMNREPGQTTGQSSVAN